MTRNNRSQVLCAKSKIVFYDYSELDWKRSGLKLFKIELSDFEDEVDLLIRFLQPDEVLRARRYHYKKDVDRFIICRSALKFLLAKQTGLMTEDIFIQNDGNKKPYLASDPAMFFNLSHSGDRALIALGDRAMGVDVERIDSAYDYSQVLPQIFSETEIDELLKSKNPLRIFYTFWTRKEAIVKATGKGIDDTFKEIPSMDGLHSRKPSLLGAIHKLQVKSFDFDDQYMGALATTDHDVDLRNIPCYKIPSILQYS
ncbi:4'-phosphopantetheinyl transferase family protein [Maribacter sp. 2304DJ31-5]|uniref:4'-phosphopantetheinyl transferase family protein n=1 Tax=Maribacter sp. 2304DJ31-5 TaxID=3386273 RepID=UPI0039BC7616